MQYSKTRSLQNANQIFHSPTFSGYTYLDLNLKEIIKSNKKNKGKCRLPHIPTVDGTGEILLCLLLNIGDDHARLYVYCDQNPLSNSNFHQCKWKQFQ